MRRLLSFITPTVLLQPLAASPAADPAPRVHPEVAAWAIRAATANGFGGDFANVRHPAGGRAVAVQPVAFVDLSDPMASAVVRARRYARRALALFRLLRRRARQRGEMRQLQSLDAATLRDLGLSRSEIGSVYAECTGRIAATRRRVIEHETFRLRTAAPAGTGPVS